MAAFAVVLSNLLSASSQEATELGGQLVRAKPATPTRICVSLIRLVQVIGEAAPPGVPRVNRVPFNSKSVFLPRWLTLNHSPDLAILAT